MAHSSEANKAVGDNEDGVATAWGEALVVVVGVVHGSDDDETSSSSSCSASAGAWPWMEQHEDDGKGHEDLGNDECRKTLYEAQAHDQREQS